MIEKKATFINPVTFEQIDLVELMKRQRGEVKLILAALIYGHLTETSTETSEREYEIFPIDIMKRIAEERP